MLESVIFVAAPFVIIGVLAAASAIVEGMQ